MDIAEILRFPDGATILARTLQHQLERQGETTLDALFATDAPPPPKPDYASLSAHERLTQWHAAHPPTPKYPVVQLSPEHAQRLAAMAAKKE